MKGAGGHQEMPLPTDGQEPAGAGRSRRTAAGGGRAPARLPSTKRKSHTTHIFPPSLPTLSIPGANSPLHQLQGWLLPTSSAGGTPDPRGARTPKPGRRAHSRPPTHPLASLPTLPETTRMASLVNSVHSQTKKAEERPLPPAGLALRQPPPPPRSCQSKHRLFTWRPLP